MYFIRENENVSKNKKEYAKLITKESKKQNVNITANQAERVATVCNKGYNSLRRNFLPKIPAFLLLLELGEKNPADFSATKS